MALVLYPPGSRKGNKTWLIRGRVGGRLYEKITGTTDEKTARRILRQCQDAIKAAPAGERVTFAQAAQRYIEFRNPRRFDRQCIDRLVAEIGRRPIRELTPADLHDTANLLGRDWLAATKNRNVLRPAISILHHAARAGLCPWLRCPLFPQPKPRARALTADAAAAMIAAAKTPEQRRLLVWLFLVGTRISDTLAVRWTNIDLAAATVRMRIGKIDEDREFALHPAIVAELRVVPEEARIGRVHAWSDRSSLRRWLPGVAETAGVPGFTPHMARHTLGTMLARNGETLIAIMAALGHAQASSSLRYQSGDVEMIRAAVERIELPHAKIVGKVA